MRGNLPGNTVNDPGARKSPQAGETGAFGGILPQDREEDLLVEKKYKCPMCGKTVYHMAVKTKKPIPDGVDIDLHPRYKNIDPIKYHVVECNKCGYATLDNDFEFIRNHEKKAVDGALKVSPMALLGEIVRTYDNAYRMYKSAYRISIIKGVSGSERGLISLYTAWLLRGWREELSEYENLPGSDEMSEENEQKYLKYALLHFNEALSTEPFPIRGLDEGGFYYLLAALNYKLGARKDAIKCLSKTLYSTGTGTRIRVMAEDLREIIKSDS